ncbi:MAG TPA: RHS repeat domain-containing protein [Kofleriaceae bacterium]|nr:RHS repeat domain-containing protein [Kofleriaceae bacterium]
MMLRRLSLLLLLAGCASAPRAAPAPVPAEPGAGATRVVDCVMEEMPTCAATAPGEGPYVCTTTDYQYDAHGNLIHERGGGPERRYTYTYDAQGRWTHRHYQEPYFGRPPETDDVEREYDGHGLIRETVVHRHPVGQLVRTVRAFDRSGNPVSESETGDGNKSIGELRWRYRYDAAGRWIRRERVNLYCHECGVEVTVREYDRAGNLVREQEPGSDQGYRFQYDAQGRLVRRWRLEDPKEHTTYSYSSAAR